MTAIDKFRKRRADRLADRHLNEMYEMYLEHEDEWTKEQSEKHPRSKNGRFARKGQGGEDRSVSLPVSKVAPAATSSAMYHMAPSSGSSASSSSSTSSPSPKTGSGASASPTRAKGAVFVGKNAKGFSDALREAKSTVSSDKAWRVFAGDEKYFSDEHPGASFYVTSGGSTVSVDDGDIIGVCKNSKDTEHTGKDLIQFAISNGGNKLDSYSGNHGFYVKCGFEPVSWCEWDDEYAPDDWEEKYGREPVVFYKYVGEGNVHYRNLNEFLSDVGASDDYMAAQKYRDENM